MYCWRFFILIIAVLGPVASFSQRGLTDVRQQCVGGREREIALNRNKLTSTDSTLKNRDTARDNRERTRELSERRRNEVRHVEPRVEFIFARASVHDRRVIEHSIRARSLTRIARSDDRVLTREMRRESDEQRIRSVTGNDRQLNKAVTRISENRNIQRSRSRGLRESREIEGVNTFLVGNSRNIRSETERNAIYRTPSARSQRDELSRDQRTSRNVRDLTVVRHIKANNVRNTRHIQERARNERFVAIRERQAEPERRRLEVRSGNMDRKGIFRKNVATLGVRASERLMSTRRAESSEERRSLGNEQRFAFRLSDREESRRVNSREGRIRDTTGSSNRQTYERRDTATRAERTDFRRIREALTSQKPSRDVGERFDERRDIAIARNGLFRTWEISKVNRLEPTISRDSRAIQDIRSVNTQRLPAENHFRYRRETENKRDSVTPKREMLSGPMEKDSRRISEPSSKDTNHTFTDKWKTLLFYTLQGIYICGVILQFAGGNGLKANKLVSWLPPSQHSLKVD